MTDSTYPHTIPTDYTRVYVIDYQQRETDEIFFNEETYPSFNEEEY